MPAYWIPIDVHETASHPTSSHLYSTRLLKTFKTLLNLSESLHIYTHHLSTPLTPSPIYASELQELLSSLWTTFQLLSHSQNIPRGLLTRYMNIIANLEPPFHNLEKLFTLARYIESYGHPLTPAERLTLSTAWKNSGVDNSPIQCMQYAINRGLPTLRSLLHHLVSNHWAATLLIHRMIALHRRGDVLDAETLDVCFEVCAEMRAVELAVLLWRVCVGKRKLVLRMNKGERSAPVITGETQSNVSLDKDVTNSLPETTFEKNLSDANTSATLEKGAVSHCSPSPPRRRRLPNPPRRLLTRHSTLAIALHVYNSALPYYPTSPPLYIRFLRVAHLHSRLPLIQHLLTRMNELKITPPPSLIASTILLHFRLNNIANAWGTLMRTLEAMRDFWISDALAEYVMIKLLAFSVPKAAVAALLGEDETSRRVEGGAALRMLDEKRRVINGGRGEVGLKRTTVSSRNSYTLLM
ncbi:hypothetical protein BC829DRAFT_443073 [Chytridium lagenaria]|nr:hypothetical protein BC829DRAFT_443073 [Chytridium lagenaria]